MTKRNSARRGDRDHERVPTIPEVRSMIRGKLEAALERKIFTNTVTTQTASNIGAVIALSQSLTQGDNINQRSGDKITVLSITARTQFILNAAASQSTVRYILFYDTSNNGALPAVTEVLQNSTVNSPYKPEYLLRKRFHVLKDVSYPLVQSAQNQVVHKDFFFYKKFPIFYLGTADLAAANSKNALFVLVITDATVNQPNYLFTHEIQYYDA